MSHPHATALPHLTHPRRHEPATEGALRRPPALPARWRELDEATLTRAQDGDRAAQRALLERYQGRVIAFLARRLADRGRDVVEDLTQDVFLRVFRALPSFVCDGRARLSTWILTIASRRAIDEVRRRRVVVGFDEEQAATSSRGPDLYLDHRALSLRLWAALEGLSPAHRTILVYREVDELAYDEIAERMGVDLGTVKSRIFRARAALRRAIDELDEEVVAELRALPYRLH
ncbi:MAG: sigma-70 family RNA polymerase sigma factor [Nannocystaceae bacterium]